MSLELLPWYVTGTLSTEERLAVERELTLSVAARDDLRLWSAVAHEVAAEPRGVDAGVDIGWMRLARQLSSTPPARARWQRFRLAAAAALVAIIGAQSLIIYQQAQQVRMQQLGSAPGGIREDEWRIQVRFRPAATIAQTDSLLLANDARVIEGPSALGIYEVAVSKRRFVDAAAAARWFGEQPEIEQGAAPP
jgi:anti-sigma factor RsiW